MKKFNIFHGLKKSSKLLVETVDLQWCKTISCNTISQIKSYKLNGLKYNTLNYNATFKATNASSWMHDQLIQRNKIIMNYTYARMLRFEIQKKKSNKLISKAHSSGQKMHKEEHCSWKTQKNLQTDWSVRCRKPSAVCLTTWVKLLVICLFQSREESH